MSGGQDNKSDVRIPGLPSQRGEDNNKHIERVLGREWHMGKEVGLNETGVDYDGPQAHVEEEDNPIQHPNHYNLGNIEVTDFIEDQGHLGWCRQNAIKYICRSGAKKSESKEQSIKKAIYYLERELGMHRKEKQ